MNDLTYLELACITFALSCDKSVKLLDSEPAYHPFFRKVHSYSEIIPVDVRIDIQIGKMPNIDNRNKLFDSCQSWAMFEVGSDYFISLKPSAFKHPLWLARINRNLSEATVYCGQRIKSRENGKIFISNPFQYPLDQILLMYILSQREGAIIHSAGINIDNKGCLFPGQSGAGKSTLIKQFVAGGYGDLLSDDRIVVRKFDDNFNAYGTPWPGEAGIAENSSVPLAGIFFINHGFQNRIIEIKPKQAVARLLPVISIPWYHRDIIPKILDFCESLVLNVPVYELDFKPSVEVVDVLKKFITS